MTVSLSSLSDSLWDYVLCRKGTRNAKTANVPGASVRSTHWDVGCKACPRYSSKDCYAIDGRAGHHMHADRAGTMAARSERVPSEYTLRYALAGCARSARVFRWSVVGDSVGSIPAHLLQAGYRACVDERLNPIDYTSTWKLETSSWAKPWAMASCHSVSDVWRALGDGWRTTLTVDPDLMADAIERGKTSMVVECSDGGPSVVGRMCPAMVADYKGERPISCNECMLCSVHHLPPHPNRAKAGIDVVLFALHGIRGRGHRWSRRRKAYRAGGAA
jgi:hypothetical protein